jgi:hypothetical protein
MPNPGKEQSPQARVSRRLGSRPGALPLGRRPLEDKPKFDKLAAILREQLSGIWFERAATQSARASRRWRAARSAWPVRSK